MFSAVEYFVFNIYQYLQARKALLINKTLYVLSKAKETLAKGVRYLYLLGQQPLIKNNLIPHFSSYSDISFIRLRILIQNTTNQ